ncbi:hypothetical protein [Duganella sp. FT27W]|uniref:hypothetical protein n=1 Tax=Duganella sp. FT27W TaxID=2654636 RepID=UPI00128B8487|nr:hypothetical protein [Duganella sp. FT27W]MPQ56233.1 hypothetical protein [Duganella sp. FT27W]
MSDQKYSAIQAPHVMMCVGPDGSGKTSLIDDIKQTVRSTLRGRYPVPERFINPGTSDNEAFTREHVFA